VFGIEEFRRGGCQRSGVEENRPHSSGGDAVRLADKCSLSVSPLPAFT
jgi:hypothetical protein